MRNIEKERMGFTGRGERERMGKERGKDEERERDGVKVGERN